MRNSSNAKIRINIRQQFQLNVALFTKKKKNY